MPDRPILGAPSVHGFVPMSQAREARADEAALDQENHWPAHLVALAAPEPPPPIVLARRRPRRPVDRLAVLWAAARPGVLVFLAALVLRLLVAVVAGDTYDPDEFVALALGRSLAHGAVPYRDFTYFHPPGLLVLVAALQPLVHFWWPLARIAMLAIDSLTAVVVWRVGRVLYGSRTALAAGILYAVSPLTLVSATRVGPDPLITALGMLGLMLLLRKGSRLAPIWAGVCLGLAVWTKYPGLIFLPIYLLAAPRQAVRMLVGFGIACILLFGPLLIDARSLFADTVLWQLSHRDSSDLLHRLGSVGAYWLGLNCLGLAGMVRRRSPRWLCAGFLAGTLFLFTAQAYYHYFVPVVPFAALLGAPLVQPFLHRGRAVVAAGALALSVLWALDLDLGPPGARLFVSAPRLSSAQKAATVIERQTPPRSSVLTDEFEYALLAHRPVLGDYFWNMQNTESARALERLLPRVTAVVQTTDSGPTYPPGFADYLADHHLPHVRTGGTIVWLLRQPGPASIRTVTRGPSSTVAAWWSLPRSFRTGPVPPPSGAHFQRPAATRISRWGPLPSG